MRLRVVTPEALVADDREVVSIRAEDETGSFGVQERHAEFVTTLAISVLSWTDPEAGQHHAAVRGGVLRVERGGLVEVATREAVLSEDLEELQRKVVARLREDASAEARERTRAAQLDAAVVRHLEIYVRGRHPPPPLHLGGRDDDARRP
jgi:F-type H+-transporting ATPase subunit epsilon